MIIKNVFNEQCITYSQMSMVSNARFFWRRFTIWIRVYIISRYKGLGSPEEAFNRLYSETSGIGNFLQITYELESSNDIAQLLNQFTYALRDLIDAQLQGNIEAMNQSVARLYSIAGNFAAYLFSINPYTNEAEWREMMETYIIYTMEQANSFLAGNYSDNIESFNRLTELTNRMGDALAYAIYDYVISGAQVIPTVGQECITYEQMSQIYNLRRFHFELVTWTREYMLSRYKIIGNANEVKARLSQVPVEYIDVLQQFFGKHLDNYLQILNNYINLIDNLITAQTEGNINEIRKIQQLLYQNADQRAEIVTSLTPFFDQNEWRSRLYRDIPYTIEQSTTFLTGDYARNLDVFRALLDQAQNTSAYFSRGLFNYLISQNRNE